MYIITFHSLNATQLLTHTNPCTLPNEKVLFVKVSWLQTVQLHGSIRNIRCNLGGNLLPFDPAFLEDLNFFQCSQCLEQGQPRIEYG